MNRNNRSGAIKFPLFEGNSPLNANNVVSLSELKEPKKSLRSTEYVLKFLDTKSDVHSNDFTDLNEAEDVPTTNFFNDVSKDNSVLQYNSDKIIFTVVYGKKTTKKHKTYHGDGLLEINGKYAILKDLKGKIIGRTSIKPGSAIEGEILSIGNNEIEIIEKASLQETTESESEKVILEPPAKKFKKQQFISLIPSGESELNKFRINRCSVVNKQMLLKPKSPVSSTHVESRELLINESFEVLAEPDTTTKTVVQNVSKENSFSECSPSVKIIFKVVYGKKTTKKHKTYEEDGILEVCGKNTVLKDMGGKVVGRTSVKPGSVDVGLVCSVGNKEIEVIEKISCEESLESVKTESKVITFQQPIKEVKRQQFIPVKSGKNLNLNYEPLVMPHPNREIEWDSEDVQIREVSVDFCLASILRPYQRFGLIFLYKCVMGINSPNCHGAILADEMGLGKTLQCISLVWTLLKQGPYGKPVARRVLIVAPSSLCANWKKEFIHWLGSQRISPFVVEGKNKPKNFVNFPKTSVMIISYEMFVRNFDDVNNFNFDLLICDEGHRLKNSEVKTLKMLNQLNCKKRILLTGTPIQNDLKELYTLSDFVNPGIFEDSMAFKKYYENPIVASQKPDASEDVIELGQERAKELHERTKLFILRRTNNLINKYLPQKHELVIFCRFTHEQENLYNYITNEWFNRSVLPASGSTFPLTVITILKKICNHPALLRNDKGEVSGTPSVQKMVEKLCIKGSYEYEHSGKLIVVRTLMRSLKFTSEKLVLISYFTQTLDLLEKICCSENFKFCRLDGSTSSGSRMKIVEQFNCKDNDYRVFLLSAKAGGVGLNLPGASRLILFDSDWNPASDAQAMARIWREGQKKSVYLYRLLTTGTIEEKIYQRQISKTGLSEAVVDSNHLASLKLSTSELKDLFTLVHDTNSVTHDLMDCLCNNKKNEMSVEINTEEKTENEQQDYQFNLHEEEPHQHLTMNQLLQWEHYNQPVAEELLEDLMLKQASDYITFVFKNSSQSDK